MPKTGMYDNAEQPLAETVTSDGQYRYRLYSNDVVGIQKPDPGAADGWKTEYVFRDGVCPCVGHQYRGDCKHRPVAMALIQWWHQVGSQQATTTSSAPAGA